MATIMEPAAKAGAKEIFDVGGVQLPRPFKVRRLGHFGLNVSNMAENIPFYTDLLGFRVSDSIDFGPRMAPEQRATPRTPAVSSAMAPTTMPSCCSRARHVRDARRAKLGREELPSTRSPGRSARSPRSSTPSTSSRSRRSIMRAGRDMPG